MPVVTVALPPHPAEGELLSRVAEAVAEGLGLSAGDVIAMSVPVRAAVANGRTGTASWVLISIHGSDRGEERMRHARDAAASAAADWSERHDVAQEGVWCEWLLPQHP
jgi:hypothetical protein